MLCNEVNNMLQALYYLVLTRTTVPLLGESSILQCKEYKAASWESCENKDKMHKITRIK